MPDAKPLTRDEREWQVNKANIECDEVLSLGLGGDRNNHHVLRYEATVRAVEARIEALREALEAAASNALAALAVGEPADAKTYVEAIHEALESQASGDYSVTRTPETAGGE